LINVDTKERIDLSTNNELIEAQKEIEGSLGAEGRVLIRQSGTEKVVRVMVEGKDLSLVQHSAEKLAEILR
jgi:phosphoglucosamine mutase